MRYGSDDQHKLWHVKQVRRRNDFEMGICCEVRDEELEELDRHRLDSCHVNVAGGSENSYGKVNILLQTHISQGRIDNFSLVSDQAYVAQVMTDFLS